MQRLIVEITMNWAPGIFINFMQDESGQDLIEYAIVAGLIGLGAVASMSGLSTKIKTTFNNIGSQLTNAT
jgi:pilus assembly protein Flp/PilA